MHCKDLNLILKRLLLRCCAGNNNFGVSFKRQHIASPHCILAESLASVFSFVC